MIRNLMTRKAETELIFDATVCTDVLPHSNLIRDPDQTEIPRSPTRLTFNADASSQDSSTSSTCITTDPLYEAAPRHPNALYNSDLHVGDLVIDKQGVEWICRRCFCEISTCDGKALKRVEGKTELDPWDRGRPVKRQRS
ncbi:hypothetical protein NX059_005523 [Plenodomus lindquistii]|nr:hypothetical protein NX059_005523 [Plenodomus lindquistii]